MAANVIDIDALVAAATAGQNTKAAACVSVSEGSSAQTMSKSGK